VQDYCIISVILIIVIMTYCTVYIADCSDADKLMWCLQKVGSHDWYCFECHRGGSVVDCSRCWRVYHPQCFSAAECIKKSLFMCPLCQVSNISLLYINTGCSTLMAVSIRRILFLLFWRAPPGVLSAKCRPVSRVDNSEPRQSFPQVEAIGTLVPPDSPHPCSTNVCQ